MGRLPEDITAFAPARLRRRQWQEVLADCPCQKDRSRDAYGRARLCSFIDGSNGILVDDDGSDWVDGMDRCGEIDRRERSGNGSF